MGQHFFSLYLDHDDILLARNWDDVVHFPVIELPPVISPAKPTGNRDGDELVGIENSDLQPVPFQVISPLQDSNVAAKTRKRRLVAVEDDEQAETEDDADQDSDFDPSGIVDSELDVSDGDDDLFEDNVDNSEDEEVKVPKGQGREKGKAEKIQEAKKMAFKEEDSEDDELWGPDTDIDAIHTRFKMFREEDLHNPKFFVGQCFESVEMLRKAMQVYSCINRQDIKVPVNDRKRLNAKCSEGCKWNLWASMSSISKCFMIKNFCGEHSHSCSRTFKRTIVRNMEIVPTPESTFIASAREELAHPPTPTNTMRQGHLAQKLLALQQEKMKALEEKKQAILEARLAAQVKKAEDAAAKRIEQEKRKAKQAAARAIEQAAKKEQRRIDAENQRKGKAVTRKFIEEVRKEQAAKRRQEALEKKQAERAKERAAKRQEKQ
ncbi:hypothetical protein QYE76_021985 [Lolium multiflorum]|uniref:Transposase MuDR plant domain-containing protein n=1 Tax=Lolium multiflorum TaxID=4521 RepID=A0AAD8RBW2_LOLMU|nr:hypothetical protein QYE76_021985 [Lolium multiflorum]